MNRNLGRTKLPSTASLLVRQSSGLFPFDDLRYMKAILQQFPNSVTKAPAPWLSAKDDDELLRSSAADEPPPYGMDR